MSEVTSLYIHIPFCISKCKYCDFFSVPCKGLSYVDENDAFNDNKVPNIYINALINELSYRAKKYGIKNLESVYIGGGTPSLLKQNQLKKIFDFLKNNSYIDNDTEITIEANPDDITDELINSWNAIGINRISLGIQSFCDKALSFVSRRANAEINKKAIKIIKNKWNKDFSVDMICGLPEQSAESFISDLQYLVIVKPDHISMYSLTIEDETPLGREYLNGNLNYNFDFADKLWLSAKDMLKANCYNHYEVSNFCLPGKECKHNLKYWNHESYIGCGSGGTGSFYKNDGSCFRWTNIENIHKYIEFWENKDSSSFYNDYSEDFEREKIKIPEKIELINKETSIFEFFMMGLRKLNGINENDFVRKFNQPIPENILRNFYKWQAMGLCEISEDDKNCSSSSAVKSRVFTLGNDGILYLNKFLEEII